MHRMGGCPTRPRRGTRPSRTEVTPDRQWSSRSVVSGRPAITISAPGLSVTLFRNVLLGLVVAAVLAVSASGASIFGVAVWKIALAVAGALVFIVAGRK